MATSGGASDQGTAAEQSQSEALPDARHIGISTEHRCGDGLLGANGLEISSRGPGSADTARRDAPGSPHLSPEGHCGSEDLRPSARTTKEEGEGSAGLVGSPGGAQPETQRPLDSALAAYAKEEWDECFAALVKEERAVAGTIGADSTEGTPSLVGGYEGLIEIITAGGTTSVRSGESDARTKDLDLALLSLKAAEVVIRVAAERQCRDISLEQLTQALKALSFHLRNNMPDFTDPGLTERTWAGEAAPRRRGGRTGDNTRDVMMPTMCAALRCLPRALPGLGDQVVLALLRETLCATLSSPAASPELAQLAADALPACAGRGTGSLLLAVHELLRATVPGLAERGRVRDRAALPIRALLGLLRAGIPAEDQERTRPSESTRDTAFVDPVAVLANEACAWLGLGGGGVVARGPERPQTLRKALPSLIAKLLDAATGAPREGGRAGAGVEVGGLEGKLRYAKRQGPWGTSGSAVARLATFRLGMQLLRNCRGQTVPASEAGAKLASRATCGGLLAGFLAPYARPEGGTGGASRLQDLAAALCEDLRAGEKLHKAEADGPCCGVPVSAGGECGARATTPPLLTGVGEAGAPERIFDEAAAAAHKALLHLAAALFRPLVARLASTAMGEGAWGDDGSPAPVPARAAALRALARVAEVRPPPPVPPEVAKALELCLVDSEPPMVRAAAVEAHAALLKGHEEGSKDAGEVSHAISGKCGWRRAATARARAHELLRASRDADQGSLDKGMLDVLRDLCAAEQDKATRDASAKALWVVWFAGKSEPEERAAAMSEALSTFVGDQGDEAYPHVATALRRVLEAGDKTYCADATSRRDDGAQARHLIPREPAREMARALLVTAFERPSTKEGSSDSATSLGSAVIPQRAEVGPLWALRVLYLADPQLTNDVNAQGRLARWLTGRVRQLKGAGAWEGGCQDLRAALGAADIVCAHGCVQAQKVADALSKAADGVVRAVALVKGGTTPATATSAPIPAADPAAPPIRTVHPPAAAEPTVRPLLVLSARCLASLERTARTSESGTQAPWAAPIQGRLLRLIKELGQAIKMGPASWRTLTATAAICCMGRGRASGDLEKAERCALDVLVRHALQASKLDGGGLPAPGGATCDSVGALIAPSSSETQAEAAATRRAAVAALAAAARTQPDGKTLEALRLALGANLRPSAPTQATEAALRTLLGMLDADLAREDAAGLGHPGDSVADQREGPIEPTVSTSSAGPTSSLTPSTGSSASSTSHGSHIARAKGEGDAPSHGAHTIRAVWDMLVSLALVEEAATPHSAGAAAGTSIRSEGPVVSHPASSCAVRELLARVIGRASLAGLVAPWAATPALFALACTPSQSSKAAADPLAILGRRHPSAVSPARLLAGVEGAARLAGLAGGNGEREATGSAGPQHAPQCGPGLTKLAQLLFKTHPEQQRRLRREALRRVCELAAGIAADDAPGARARLGSRVPQSLGSACLCGLLVEWLKDGPGTTVDKDLVTMISDALGVLGDGRALAPGGAGDRGGEPLATARHGPGVEDKPGPEDGPAVEPGPAASPVRGSSAGIPRRTTRSMTRGNPATHPVPGTGPAPHLTPLPPPGNGGAEPLIPDCPDEQPGALELRTPTGEAQTSVGRKGSSPSNDDPPSLSLYAAVLICALRGRLTRARDADAPWITATHLETMTAASAWGMWLGMEASPVPERGTKGDDAARGAATPSRPTPRSRVRTPGSTAPGAKRRRKYDHSSSEGEEELERQYDSEAENLPTCIAVTRPRRGSTLKSRPPPPAPEE